MIILNHPKIPSLKLYCIKNTNDIATTPPNSIVRFTFSWELLAYCKNNQIPAAVDIASLKEAVYANALEAKFLLCEFSLAKRVQKVAENYLFDAKVIAIMDERLIEKAIEAGIDGVYINGSEFYF